jgi:multidrug efflux pump
MGTGVFGGMLLATFVATIFIPLFFTWLTGKHTRKGHDAGRHAVDSNKESI